MSKSKIDVKKFAKETLNRPDLPPHSKRKLIKRGKRTLLSLSQEWMDQYSLYEGSNILAWLYKNDDVEMWMMPYSRELLEELSEEGYDYRKREIESVGSSYYIEIPDEWLDLLGWGVGDFTFQFADYGLKVEQPDKERVKEVHDKLTEVFFGGPKEESEE